MEEVLQTCATYVGLAIEAVAISLIALGALEAVIGIVRVVLNPATTNQNRRQVWLRFASWLVAGLTFQLAADIVGTSFAHGWDELGRVAAIAVIRTGLSYFLDREVADTRALQHRTKPQE